MTSFGPRAAVDRPTNRPCMIAGIRSAAPHSDPTVPVPMWTHNVGPMPPSVLKREPPRFARNLERLLNFSVRVTWDHGLLDHSTRIGSRTL